MYNKKYRLTNIEEINGHNPTYDDLEGVVCYLAYFNVGERGWFLAENGYYDGAHRIHTSIVQDVEYIGNQIIVTTENTKLYFDRVINGVQVICIRGN